MSHQIQLKRKLAATPDEVYAAWTDARSLSQWMVPIVGGHTDAQTDARVGGAYAITMHGVSSQHAQSGEYLRLERPRLIEFTWIADPAAEHRSIVTVELKPIGPDETELTLTHRLLPSEASAQGHQLGWDAGLDSLVAHINRPDRRHYRKELHFKAPAAALYAALSTQQGLRGWWTQTCTADEHVGGQACFEFGQNRKLMRIERLTPDRQVRWQCLESVIEVDSSKLPPNEWANTTIVFRINGDSPTHTVLRFEHLGLTPALGCYTQCEGGWDYYLASLQRYVETGAGTPHRAGNASQAA
ncbi:MAG: SRPBCC family protein [Stenotrophobium sp.]